MFDNPTEYLLLGAFVGTLAGLFGIGGGLIIVPVLATIFKHHGFNDDIIIHLAVGTSLATIIPTSISSVIAHHRRGAVLWPAFRQLAPGILVGAFLAAYIADQFSSVHLKTIIGIFAILVALEILFDIKPQAHRELPGRVAMSLTGGVIGLVSALIGIGGGTLTTPFLLWCNKAIRNAIATSAACGLPIALAGAIGYIKTGMDAPLLPEWSTGYVYWPAMVGVTLASVLFAPLGARLTHRLPVKVLKKFFAVLLVGVGIHLLYL